MADAKALTGNGVLQRLNDGKRIRFTSKGISGFWHPPSDRVKAIEKFFDDFGDPHLDDKGEETMADVIVFCAHKGVKFYAVE